MIKNAEEVICEVCGRLYYKRKYPRKHPINICPTCAIKNSQKGCN